MLTYNSLGTEVDFFMTEVYHIEQMQSKSMGWCLYDRDLRHERVE